MYENRTLGEMLSDKRIARIAKEAVRNWDLSGEDFWDKTLSEIREKRIFSGDLDAGFVRLYKAADTDSWYYPLYSEAEIQECPARSGTNIVWLPSEEEGADERPFILLIPGGGFVNVWNLTEGWPIAAQFNRLGHHVCILTYQVDGDELLEREMQDIARALHTVKEQDLADADRYITCGFSAGGYLVCLWNTIKGYPAFDLSKPRASFPIYPVTGLRWDDEGEPDEEEKALIQRLCGCGIDEAVKSVYETTEHVEHFPPCALFLAGDDGLVSPDNSKELARSLEEKGIPCRLEIGEQGGHGFGDGTDMCMSGWIERAVDWYRSL